MNAFIEKENIKLGLQGTTPFVTEEKPVWRQEQQRTFGKALGVAWTACHYEGKVHHFGMVPVLQSVCT